MEKQDLLAELKKWFGFESFRSGQQEVIANVLAGRSQLVVMPTGQGKSLCYQLPALILPGLTVVISPLIALMKDQVDQLRDKSIYATFINSSLSKDERENRLRHLRNGRYKILYVTPERFRKDEFREALKTQKVSLMVVDEAHCVSLWGHDFRPDYSRMEEIREVLGRPTVLAVTATATVAVQTDILKQLGFTSENMTVRVWGIERPNLALNVWDVYGLEAKIRAFVLLRNMFKGSTIVYFSLIQTLLRFSRELGQLNMPHLVYHGDLPTPVRKKQQERFFANESDLILATPAFGLGIDKPDVRLLVHGEMTGSVEAYFQEVGRAGRDGVGSQCHLLYDGDDLHQQLEFIQWSNPEASYMRALLGLLRDRADAVEQGGVNYIRDALSFRNSRDYRVETALNQLERWGYIKLNQRRYEILVDEKENPIEDALIEKRTLLLKTKLHEVITYTQTADCRLYWIYKYFGLEKTGQCGICDRCLKEEWRA